MRISVSPLDSGIAHITRCYEVATELANKMCNILFLVPETKVSLVGNLKRGNTIRVDSIISILPEEHRDKPIFLRAIEFLVNSVRRVKEERALYEKHGIDAVVVDLNPAAAFAAYELDLPLFIIINSHNLFFSFDLPFWNKRLKLILFPLYILSVLILSFIKLFYNLLPALVFRPWKIVGFYRYLNQSVKIVPEKIRKFEKLMNPNTFFVDWIKVRAYESLLFNSEQLEQRIQKRPLVYLTTGGTGFDKQQYKKILKILTKKGYFVVGSTGGMFEVEYNPNDSLIKDFLPGSKVCEHVEFVVNHGGHGSVMQAVDKGKPVIAYPQNPGQLLFAGRLVEDRQGVVIFSVSELEQAIEDVKKIHIKQSQIVQDGAVKAAEIILNNLAIYKQ